MDLTRDGADFAALQTKRLKALWRIVNAPNLSGDELFIALISEGADAIRPGRTFAGTLGHVEGEHYVLDVLSAQIPDDIRELLPRRVKRSDTLHVRELASARTRAWDDCQTVADLPQAARNAGLRSQISTQFTANGVRHVLTFGSLAEPSPIPFGSDDLEYVEVLASILARHMELEAKIASLRDSGWRARHHGERLERLFQVANTGKRYDAALIAAALQRGATSLRPNQPFCGLLCRLEADALVVISSVADANDRLIEVSDRLGAALAKPSYPNTRTWGDPLSDDLPGQLSDLGWRALIATRFDMEGARYVLLFASTEPLAIAFGTEDRTYVTMLALWLENVMHMSLAYGHSERLAALKAIANNSGLSGNRLMLAMLAQSAAAVRPGQTYRAILWRIEGPRAVAEVISAPGSFAGDPYVVGSTVLLERTAIGLVVAAGTTTQMWDDMQASPEMDWIARFYNTRALIISAFTTPSATWALSFASDEPAGLPFGPQDHAYVEVLATLIASHLSATEGLLADDDD